MCIRDSSCCKAGDKIILPRNVHKSVINALVVALCLKCPEQVRKNLETLEETWNNYQVYLNDEIDFIDDEPMLDYSLRRKEK